LNNVKVKVEIINARVGTIALVKGFGKPAKWKNKTMKI